MGNGVMSSDSSAQNEGGWKWQTQANYKGLSINMNKDTLKCYEKYNVNNWIRSFAQILDRYDALILFLLNIIQYMKT